MSLSEKVFEPQAKHDLIENTRVGKHSSITFLVFGHQVYTLLTRDLGQLFTETL